MSDEIMIKKSWLTRLVELSDSPARRMKNLSPEEMEILNRLDIPRLLGYCESAKGFLRTEGELEA